jgi:cardiolipin synthase
MLTLPNLITLLRVLLVPVVAVSLIEGLYAAAFVLFALAGIGDWLDGYLARRLNQTSRLGAILDPLADKLIMVSVSLILAWQGLLPVWFAALLILRDLLIVTGALAYHLLFGHVEMAPTRLSKLNTALAFFALALALADAAALSPIGHRLHLLYALVVLTLLASGANYVWIWGRKAMSARR